jgi:hypothetical protein
MVTADFGLELLRRKVIAYREQSDADQAACEKFLAQGIKLLEGLRSYEDRAHEAAQMGIAVPEEVALAIKSAYRDWLGACDRAEARIQALGDRPPKNAAEFRKACEFAKNRIAAFERFATIDEALSGRLFTPDYIGAVEESLAR